MAGPEHQQQPEIAASNDEVAMNDTQQSSPFDVVGLFQEARRDTGRMTEVERGIDMLRNGSLERFGRYISNNPDVEEGMRRELGKYGIELDVQRFAGGNPKPEVTLSTPIDGTTAIRRGLVIRSTGVTPEIVVRGDQYSTDQAIFDFKNAKHPISVDAFKAELNKRVPPRTQTGLG